MQKIDSKFYASLTKAILNKNLKNFAQENNIPISLLALFLQCSESYINKIIDNKVIPSAHWLGRASKGMYFATKKYRARESTSAG